MTVLGYTPVVYTYDAADRISQVSQGTTVVAFSHDTADRRTGVTLPNGVQIDYGYDTAGQLTSINYTKGATSIGNLTYAYDGAGRRIQIGGSLAQVNLPAGVTTASYDSANRLTTWGTQSLSYDDNGNQVSRGASSLTWNGRNQLVATSDGASTFAYDALGRRVSRTVSGTTTLYLHDGQSPVLSGTDFLLSGLDLDEVYALVTPSGTASVLMDGLGSTIGLTDGSGASTATFTYEPYGATTSSGASDIAFRFTGREDDGASGLYYFRARYYSTSFSRFVSADPIGLRGGPNAYAYASGNPLSFTDPLGLAPTAACDAYNGIVKKACQLCVKAFCEMNPAAPACCAIEKDECIGKTGGDGPAMEECNAEFGKCMLKNRKGGKKPPSPPPDI
jgi:RHS repeat-associated protein